MESGYSEEGECFLLMMMIYVYFEGYRGKAKPNLLTQETHSIACAFRILFRLYSDPKRNDSIDVLKRRILKYEIC